MSIPFGAHRLEPGVAGPGVEAPTTTQGPPETREKHHITTEHSPARRRLLLGLFGLGGALALGGVGWAVSHDADPQRPPSNGSGAGVLPETSSPSPLESPTARGDFDVFPRVYEKELTRDEITMPPKSKLNASRVEDAVFYVGQAIQYSVNKEPDRLYDTVTGRFDLDAMQPDQLKLRADYIKEHNGDSIDDHPPILPTDYAWGFQLRPLKLVNDRGYLATLEVEVTMGDYRPNNVTVAMEPPKKYRCHATFMHQANLMLGGEVPNGGWGLYRLDPIKEGDPALLPPSETILNDMPAGYNGVPLLYPGQIG